MKAGGVKILGAVLAGGQLRRFGGDKALAMIDGMPMIERVIASLAPQVDAIVLCGRDWPGHETLADRPEGGAGPLAGLNAALHHALTHGYDGALAVPVDVLPLPEDLAARLVGEGPAVLERQYAVGWWPASLGPRLDAWLAQGHRRIGQWMAEAGAERRPEPEGMRNINRPEDWPADPDQGRQP